MHGGGWVQGARGQFQHWGKYLAARGVALFAISYRFAKTGQKTFPHAVQDVLAAIQYVRGSAKDLNVAPTDRRVRPFRRRQSRLARGARRARFAGGYPQDAHAKVGTEVKVFAGVYGVYDVAEMWGRYNIQSPKQNNIEMFTGASLADNRQVYFDASPISYAVRANNKVAVHLSVGTEDDLVDRRAHTDAFVLALKQAGFFVRTTILQGAPHYLGSDPIDEPDSFSGFLAPRLMRFLQEELNSPRIPPQEVGGWRRSPHVGDLLFIPDLRPLRAVVVPGPRIEIAELLVLHLIELGEELDHQSS